MTEQQTDDIPVIEWIIGAIGVILVAGVIIYLVYQAATGDGAPPDIEIVLQEITPLANGYHVDILVKNHGSTTAQALVIEGVLMSDGEEVETSQITLDYAAPRAQIDSGLFFTENPTAFELQLRALGYQNP